MKASLTILLSVVLTFGCKAPERPIITVEVCGDLVVPDEIDAVRLSVYDAQDARLSTALYVLANSLDGFDMNARIEVPEVTQGGRDGASMGGASSEGVEFDLPPDPRLGEGAVGDSCQSSGDCGFDNATCLTSADGFPRGVCTLACGPSLPGCPKYGVDAPRPQCAAFDDEQIICLARCSPNLLPDNGGCRPGYICEARPDGRRMNRNRKVCVPNLDVDMSADVVDTGGQADVELDVVEAMPPDRPEGNTLTGTYRISRPENAVRLRVEGHRRGVVLITADAIVSSSVTVPLSFRCLGATNCPGGTTCIDGECVATPLEGECP